MSAEARHPESAPPPARDPRLQVDPEGLAGLWTRFTRRVSQGELGALPVIIGLIVIWLYFSISEENFLTAGNITNLFLQITALGVIATGVVLVLLLGEIDLSVGIVSGLAAACMAVVNTKHGLNCDAYRRMFTKSLTMNGSPPVKESCSTPSATASSMNGAASASVMRPSRESPGFAPSRQKGHFRLQAVPV